jgi:hypothetical protein
MPKTTVAVSRPTTAMSQMQMAPKLFKKVLDLDSIRLAKYETKQSEVMKRMQVFLT